VSASARLRRNRVAAASATVFILIAACCAAAPIYSHHVAHIGPNTNNLSGTTQRGDGRVDVVSPSGVPVGPAWSSRYLLGADGNGRDAAVRLLYGGRNSLLISIAAALVATILGTALGLAAGYLRGIPDVLIRGYFDLAWSFPALLFAIALGSALATDGLQLGPLTIGGGSRWIPTLILAGVFVPYVGRPVRGQTRTLARQPFIEAAVAQGMSRRRILFSELLPNVLPTVLTLSTIVVANTLLAESALSYLGVGVQSPDASWGGMVSEGIERLTTAPHLAIVPGLAITLTVLSLNVFVDALRAAMSPYAQRGASR
jgi:peptide/nickel transport system permease protein